MTESVFIKKFTDVYKDVPKEVAGAAYLRFKGNVEAAIDSYIGSFYGFMDFVEFHAKAELEEQGAYCKFVEEYFDYCSYGYDLLYSREIYAVYVDDEGDVVEVSEDDISINVDHAKSNGGCYVFWVVREA